VTPDLIEILGDATRHIIADQLGRHLDGIADTRDIGAAMAFDDDAVEPQKDRSIMIVRIEMDFEQRECGAG